MNEPTCSEPVSKSRPVRMTRGRVLGLALVSALMGAAVIVIWTIRNAGMLPDVGDPFDVREALRPVVVADQDNAFVFYTQAANKLTKFPGAFAKIDFATVTWAGADDALRAWLEANGEALELWRQGTERPDALYHQAGTLTWDTPLPVVQHLGTFTRLAALEAARHQAKGEMSEAWTWYRAMLRSSRHVGMRGVLIERLNGAGQHRIAAQCIGQWAADRRVDANMLRRALDDDLAADALTPPLSAGLKLDCLVVLRGLDELGGILRQMSMPGGRYGWLEQVVAKTGAKPQIQRISLRVTNDAERSRRATRLLYANWLAQSDRPAKERAPVAIWKPTMVFEADPTAPLAARAVSPEILVKAIDQTALAREVFEPDDWKTGRVSMSDELWQPTGGIARETRRRAALIVMVAAELYRRERGKAAAKAGDLVGPYLRELPADTMLDDPIPAKLD